MCSIPPVKLRCGVLRLVVADHLVAVFIPQANMQRFQARFQRKRLNLEDFVFVVARFKFVIGNTRAEVVNVVKPDVPAEPLQNLRQFVKRTAM